MKILVEDCFGVMMGWRRCVVAMGCTLALAVAVAVERADFVSGFGTEGWSYPDGSCLSPVYPNSVRRILIDCTGSAPGGSMTVYARTTDGAESQVAVFSAVTDLAAFTFGEGTDFRSFRLVAGGGMLVTSFEAEFASALRACPISGLAEGVYVETFDSLAALTETSGGKEWLNGVTLPYWQAWKGDAAIGVVGYNGGKIRTGGLYALAVSQKDEGRALGGYSPKDAPVVWGVAFTNDTEATMRFSGLSYQAQQWGFANAVAHAFSCSYLVTNRIDWMVGITNGWRSCVETLARAYGETDAHDVPEVVDAKYAPDSPPRVDPGEVLLLRWSIMPPASGNSALMAIDELRVTFVRESRPFVIRIVEGGERTP